MSLQMPNIFKFYQVRHLAIRTSIVVFLVIAPWVLADAAGLSLSSSAFSAHASIPKRYTCQGKNISPPLRWQGVPKVAKSLVLIVTDPDAPDPSGPTITWVHWVLYNLPAVDGSLPTATKTFSLPKGSIAARNGWGKREYGGPCPPAGRHRYFFKLYALDSKLHGLSNPGMATVVKAMQGHIIASTELVGTYQKHP